MNKRPIIIFLNLISITVLITLLTIGLADAQADSGFADTQPAASPIINTYTSPAIGKTAGSSPGAAPNVFTPVDCNLWSSPIVGYEISKGQDANDVNTFLNDLIAAGYNVGTVDMSAGPIPACVDILIVLGLANNDFLSSDYTAANGTTLQSWVTSGHGLALFSDWGDRKQPTQALFQTFGYTVLGTIPASDPTDFDPLGTGNFWVIYQPDNFASHPILNGISVVEFLLSAWLTPATDAIITTDAADAVPPNVPVMAAFTRGQGCVVLSTDSNWVSSIDNGYIKENPTTARQMIDWLNNCSLLSLSKSASSSTVQTGQLLTYTVQATNHATVALSNVRITDTVPAGMTFVSASSPYSGPDGNGVVTWNVGTMGVGSSDTVTMTVQINNGLSVGTIITNTAYIENNGAAAGSATVLVTVTALPPTAVSGGPYNVNEGSSVLLDGSSSTDPNSLPLSYAWDLDNDGLFDDATGTTTTFSAAALDDGVFPVALLVNNGTLTDTDSSSVTVNNVAPNVILTSTNWTLQTGQATSFTGSFTDPGVLDTHQIVWDFGDGSGPTAGTLNENHTFAAAGQYTVTLTITDDDGGVGQDAGLVTVVQQILPPTAVSGGPYSVNEGSSVLLNGSGSSDPNSLPLSFTWDLDNDSLFDDATGVTTNFSAAARDDGVYPVGLHISNGTYTDTNSTAVTVLNVAPQVTLAATSWQILAGQSVTFTGDFTDPGALDTHQIVWDYGAGGGTTAGSLQESVTYPITGAYTVSFTVSDDDGGVGQTWHILQVGNLPTIQIFLPIIAGNICTQSSNPLDVVLAIDISSSMNRTTEPGGSTRLDAAKAAADTFINLLNFPADQAGLVSFGNGATLEHQLSVDAASLHDKLQSLTAGGSTRMDLALIQSKEELTGPRHHGASIPAIILLTDGRPNGTTNAAVLAEAAAAKAAGITIYTIGLGDEVDVGLMKAVASDPTNYYHAPSTADLNSIYQAIASQIHCD